MREAVGAIRSTLDRLADAGGTLDVWWRDDDAVAHTPALDRLLALARAAACPLSIAAIPAHVAPSLSPRLASEDAVLVLVHGWRHHDHAPPGSKRAEFGPGRPLGDMAAETSRGLATIRDAFGGRALPVFVPPWNRVDPALAATLAEQGYAAISTFGPARPSPLPVLNTHLDPVDWHGSRSLASPETIAASFSRHVRPATGPTNLGFLTHHLVADEAVWLFCERLMAVFHAHSAVRFRSMADMLNVAAPGRTREAARTLTP